MEVGMVADRMMLLPTGKPHPEHTVVDMVHLQVE